LAKVKSSAITARHPEVPNLICTGMKISAADFRASRG
jgi:hypothetical protein